MTWNILMGRVKNWVRQKLAMFYVIPFSAVLLRQLLCLWARLTHYVKETIFSCVIPSVTHPLPQIRNSIFSLVLWLEKAFYLFANTRMCLHHKIHFKVLCMYLASTAEREIWRLGVLYCLQEYSSKTKKIAVSVSTTYSKGLGNNLRLPKKRPEMKIKFGEKDRPS